jgi:hypothetical protein
VKELSNAEKTSLNPTPKKVLGKKRRRETYRFQMERLRKTKNNPKYMAYFSI